MRDGWVDTVLGELAEITTGSRAKGGAITSGIPSIGGEQIAEDRSIKFNKMKFIPKDHFESMRTGKLKFGDSLIVKDGATTGKVGYWGYDIPAAVNEHVFILRAKPDCAESYFINLLISHRPFREEIESRTRGIIGGITRDIENIELVVPSLPEQKRIVDLISSVDAYIEALQKQLKSARQLLQALCQKTFLAESNFVQLHTVATCIMGQSPEGSSCNKDGTGTPLLTGPTEFQRNNWVGPPRQWTINETKISISQDILFCVRGATAGRMNLTNYRSVIGRGLAAIRCEDPIDTHFVRFALQFGLNQLLPSAGGTIFPNISQSQLRGFNLPWPNETERRSLASLLKSVENNAETLDQNLATTKILRSSLLHDLLSGEQEIPTSYDKVMGAA